MLRVTAVSRHIGPQITSTAIKARQYHMPIWQASHNSNQIACGLYTASRSGNDNQIIWLVLLPLPGLPTDEAVAAVYRIHHALIC